jgi:lambda repressor-like predicted transcriptional regulator
MVTQLDIEDDIKRQQIVAQLHRNGRDIRYIAELIGEKPQDVTARLARLRAIKELPA